MLNLAENGEKDVDGEISSDLYRDQFLGKFLNSSPQMFIFMFPTLSFVLHLMKKYTPELKNFVKII